MKKTIEETYKQMSEVEHILARPGMYVGSTKEEQKSQFVYDYTDGMMKMKEISIIPGMVKLIDEIISNSTDEYRRPTNLGLNKIIVKFAKDNKTIYVSDNGGIPVAMHKDAGMWLPKFIFGQLRTSSNYNDDEDRAGVGTNGLGSVLTNIFSSMFTVYTCDGKKKFQCTWNNFKYDETSIVIQNKAKKNEHGTTIAFKLNFDNFDTTEKKFTDDIKDIIMTRALNAAVANLGLAVEFIDESRNIDTTFQFNDFKEYIELYRNYIDIKNIIEYKDANKQVFVIPDGSIDIGFVNGAECSQGTHIKALHQLINAPIIELLKKKNKIEVTSRQCDGNYSMFCDLTISNPAYDSQTKDCLTTPVERFYKDENTTFELTSAFLNKVCKSEVVNNIIDWYNKKQQVEDQRAIRKINREISKGLKRPDKFITCVSKKKNERQLWIFEGDSAKAAFRNCRNPQYQAGYIMRGVPKSAWDASPIELMKNEVYNDLVTILGLKFGKDFNINDVKFSKIVISSDMDDDGHHICGLLLNFFNNWPELFEKKMIVRSISPLVIATKGKTTKNFYSMDEYAKEKSRLKNYTFKFSKGLGGLNNSESKEMYQNPKFQVFTKDDLAESMLKKWFNKDDSNTRKELLQ